MKEDGRETLVSLAKRMRLSCEGARDENPESSARDIHGEQSSFIDS